MNGTRKSHDGSDLVDAVEIPQEKEHVSTHRDYVSPVSDAELPKGYFYSPLFVGSYAVSAPWSMMYLSPSDRRLHVGSSIRIHERGWSLRHGGSEPGKHQR